MVEELLVFKRENAQKWKRQDCHSKSAARKCEMSLQKWRLHSEEMQIAKQKKCRLQTAKIQGFLVHPHSRFCAHLSRQLSWRCLQWTPHKTLYLSCKNHLKPQFFWGGGGVFEIQITLISRVMCPLY